MSRINDRLVNSSRVLREQDVIDAPDSTSRTNPPSAYQVKLLNEKIEGISSITTKPAKAQKTIPSGLNFFSVDIDSGMQVSISNDEIPEHAKIIEVIVRCLESVTGGTMQIFHGGKKQIAMTNAMSCSVENSVVRAAKLIDPRVTDNGLSIIPGSEEECCELVIIYI